MYDESKFKAVPHRVQVSLVPYLLVGAGTDYMAEGEIAECDALTAAAIRQHGAGSWQVNEIGLDAINADDTCIIDWMVPRLHSLTLFGTVFRVVHTGVTFAFEAIGPNGERILICDNECEDLPTARDWMIGVYDDGENLVATHYSGGRMDQVQPFGTVDEVADLFAGVASIPVRVACTYGVGL